MHFKFRCEGAHSLGGCGALSQRRLLDTIISQHSTKVGEVAGSN